MGAGERSWWGWGYADRFPSESQRQAIGEMVATLLGTEDPEPLAPARLEDLEIPKPAIEPPSHLEVPVSASNEDRARRAYGKAFPDLLRAFEGTVEHPPDLVARPEDEDQVRTLLSWASDEQVAIVPFGGGTSVVGGVEPEVGDGFSGTMSLDLGALDQVLEVDEVSQVARIQAGALGPWINEQLAEHGLSLRHYPQSYQFSTLGGWLATRAGGHYATLYTHIDDLLVSARLVAPGGTIETRRLPASGAGPDPNALILGSEGTLGVITEAWMRVVPRPARKAKAQVRFEAWDDAVAAVKAIVQAGLHPSQCRLLDARQALIDQVGDGQEHVLVLGFESAQHSVDQLLAQALDHVHAHGGQVVDQSMGPTKARSNDRDYRSAFMEAPYLFNVLVSLGFVVDTFETAVTWDRFPALHRALQERVGERLEATCGTGLLACRFTHAYPEGPAPYYTFLAPGTPGRRLDQWQAIKEVASDTLAEHGATITHHHAVGRTHRPWYHQEVGEDYLGALRAAKARLDPAGIMNPGALL